MFTATGCCAGMLKGMLLPAPMEDVEDENNREVGVERVVCQSGVGVFVSASGPESLTCQCEAAHAVAGLGPMHWKRVGGIALHKEVFSL